MKTVYSFIAVVGISLLLPSCFLFRGSKGAHCPAYGMEIKGTSTTTFWATSSDGQPSSDKISQ
jgi:hypothetical protein